MRFNSIQRKILSLLSLILFLTFVFVVYFVSSNQKRAIISETDKYIYTNIESIVISLRNIMLNGMGPTVVRTVDELKHIRDYTAIDIFRTNGKLAFSDDTTIKFVNRHQGAYRFEPTQRLQDTRTEEQINNDRVSIDRVIHAKSPLRTVHENTKEIEYYYPIKNLTDCMLCHGSDHTVRGVVRIRVSYADMHNKIRAASLILIVFFSGVGFSLLAILFFMMKKIIISPVLKIGEAARQIGEGNFKVKVAVKGKDEIGELADKMNSMTKGLDERFRLAKYVSHSTVEIIEKTEGVATAEKRLVTVLFADIRAFTTFAESFPSEIVIERLNRILEAEAETVQKFGGDIDKFVGDEIMAVFEDELAAVKCAKEMIEKVAELDKGYPSSLRIGVGINTGEVIAGHIGSKDRLEYALIGDTVNIASRLCSLAKPDTVLISESTYQKISAGVKAVLIPDQKIKGKKETVNIYEIKY
ncbi:MAG: HAMP domain-containing protein [Nitrospirae bacterium]|nr:HAMP domain-containing protein [Nitrospirota bacterium]